MRGKKFLIIGIIGVTSAFVVGGITIGALYNSFIFNAQKPSPTPIAFQPEETAKVSAVQSDRLPDDFPEDFPVYSNSKLIDSWSAQKTGSSAISVVWESADSEEEISDFYRESLAREEWEIKSDFESSGSAAISFEKEGVAGFVGITYKDESSTISVTMGK